MSPEQIIHFQADGIRLTGTLHLPEAISHPPFVIGCHGLLADRSSPKQIALAEALNRIGIAYFRFDHRGCGDSQGPFDSHNLLAARCTDLYHAIQAMQSHNTLGPLAGLFGSSFGGTIALATVAMHNVPWIATYAAPISSRSITRPSPEEIQTNDPSVAKHLTPYEFDISDRLSALSHILVMHGDKDEIVPLSHAKAIYENSREPKQLVIHPGGDHRMTDPDHQHNFIETCRAWFGRFFSH